MTCIKLFGAIQLVDRIASELGIQIVLSVFITPPKDESEEAYLRSCKAIGSLNWKIHWRPWITMRSHITYDALLFTSKGEGSSYVLAEAMVYEIPIIAAKAYGVSEAVSKARLALVDYKEFKAAIISLKI